MALYLVLVAENLTRIPSEAILPKVVAHNLTRIAAEDFAKHLSSDRVEGQSIGLTSVLYEYEVLHAQTDSDDCPECGEVIVKYIREIIRLLEAEHARRGESL